MPPLHRQALVKFAHPLLLLAQALLDAGQRRLEVADPDLIALLLLAQERDLVLARLLLHAQPLRLVVGLEQLGLELLELLVGVCQLLL